MFTAALDWASRGFYVFRCTPLGKEPLGGNGHRDATRDPEIIKMWWTETPHANIGASPGPAGRVVLDVDPPAGEATLAALELAHGILPDTLVIQSPRGGRHIWLNGRCATSVGTEKAGLGPKLDTRGYGGYVLLPPSRVVDEDKGIDGVYTVVNDQEIADAPAWIADTLARKREEHKAADVPLDTDTAVGRATALLTQYREAGDVAVQGAGGDDRTYRLACEVLNLGLSSAKAFDLLKRHWNIACEPPWDDDELAAKVRNAAEYAQNEAGAWAVAPATETFGAFATQQPEAPPVRSKFYPYSVVDTEAFAPPTWLIEGLIPAGGTVQLTGKQKSFKTFLALDLALGIAAGEETFGVLPKAAPVVYIAGENASALALHHVPAWCLSRGVEPALLPFYVVRAMPHAAYFEEMEEFVREIKRQEIAPALVVIDTATRALRGLDENSAKDMGQFSAACEFVQRELGATVLVIRHTGKDESRGGRGSNVIEGDFDTILDVVRHEKTFYVQLMVREQRNAAEREKPYSFKMELCGPSLVAQPIDLGEYQAQTRGIDPYSSTLVGAALSALGAVGRERAVATAVLADAMLPPLESESVADREQALGRIEKQLRNRAHHGLAGYVMGAGKSIQWFIEPLPPD